jgi:flagellar hook protein FlgE
MEISRIGGTALVAASGAARIHANNIVNANTPNFRPQTPVFSSVINSGVAVFAQSVDQPVSTIRETVGLIAASNQYKAAASLIRTGEELSKAFFEELT